MHAGFLLLIQPLDWACKWLATPAECRQIQADHAISVMRPEGMLMLEKLSEPLTNLKTVPKVDTKRCLQLSVEHKDLDACILREKGQLIAFSGPKGQSKKVWVFWGIPWLMAWCLIHALPPRQRD